MSARQYSTGMTAGLAVPAVVLYTLCIVAPLTLWVSDVLPVSASQFSALAARFSDITLQQSFVRSLAVALLACGLASLVALPAAFAVARGIRGSAWLIGLFGLLPLVMPAYLTAATLARGLSLFGFEPTAVAAPGISANEVLLVVAFALHFLPLLLFTLASAVTTIDRAQEDSARTLGAGRWVLWRQIVLPLATPGYVLGASVMLLRILDDVATPLVLNIDGMLAPAIRDALHAGGPLALPLQAGNLLLLALSTLICLLGWSALRHTGNGRVLPCTSGVPRPARTRSAIVATLTLLLALLPALALLAQVAIDDVARMIATAPLPALLNTLPAALLGGLATAVLTLLFSALVTADGPIAASLRLLTALLFVVPGVLLASAYGHAADRLSWHPDTQAWLALLSVVVFKLLPWTTYLMATRLRTVRGGIREAARNLGASPLALYTGTLARALAGSFAAIAVLGSTAVLVELSAVLLLFTPGNGSTPFSHHLFDAIVVDGGWLSAALLLIGTTVLGACLFALTWPRRRPPARHVAHDHGTPPGVIA